MLISTVSATIPRFYSKFYPSTYTFHIAKDINIAKVVSLTLFRYNSIACNRSYYNSFNDSLDSNINVS